MIKDTYRLEDVNTPKVPKLKGHLKITLRNVHNGKTEVVEGDNIVTNAVRDILSYNYFGQVDYNKFFPLWSNWYGGVLLYENAHPTTTVDNEEVLDPDNYYPQADSVNHLVAHAGGTTIDASHDDDLRRGNPTSAAFEYGNNSVKQVWEWGTTHGNGTISAISLTHKDTGDAGLGSNTYAFQNFSPMVSVAVSSFPSGSYSLTGADNIVAQYDDNHGLYFHIGDVNDYYDQHIDFSTAKITIEIKRMAYTKAGLYDRTNALNDYKTTVTVTTSVTFYANPSYYFDYETKRLWLFTNLTGFVDSHGVPTYNTSVINYTVIDLSDLSDVSEYTHGTITSDVSKLAPLGYGTNTGPGWGNTRRWFYNICKNGNYFYFPTTNGIENVDQTWYFGRFRMYCTGWQKININSQADQATVTNTTTKDIYTTPVYNNGLMICSGRVANGTAGYTCTAQLPEYNGEGAEGGSRTTMVSCNPDRPISYVTWVGNSTASTQTRYIMTNKMLNTTLYNLPTPIQKGASQAMTVEYTLSEVEPEE